MACKASWQQLAAIPETHPEIFFTCHAGLQYSRAGIRIGENVSSRLVAGQFYTQAPDPTSAQKRIRALAKEHGLDSDALLKAGAALPVLDLRLQQKIGRWLQRVAQTFGYIGRERAELMGRLQKIAEMSKLEFQS